MEDIYTIYYLCTHALPWAWALLTTRVRTHTHTHTMRDTLIEWLIIASALMVVAAGTVAIGFIVGFMLAMR